jgi:hypothetical protein
MSPLTADEITSLVSGLMVTGNQSPQNTHIRDIINAFGITQAWASVLKATNHNPTSNSDLGTTAIANPVTQTSVTANVNAPGWTALKLAMYIDSDYLLTNPGVINELMSLKTIALVAGTTTYAFTSTPVFSSIWDLLYKFKLGYTTLVSGVMTYSPPTAATGYLDITNPSTAWKQLSNGTGGVISDADIGKALHLYYVNASQSMTTFMSYITSSSAPANASPTAITHTITIVGLGDVALKTAAKADADAQAAIDLAAWVAAGSPTSGTTFTNKNSSATAAGTAATALTTATTTTPVVGTRELNALAQYKVICVYKTINNYYDAGYTWQQMIYTNTLIEAIKVKYNVTSFQVYSFVGLSSTGADGTLLASTTALPKLNAVAGVTASPGFAAVAAVTLRNSNLDSQIPSIRSKAQIADGLSFSYLAFYVLKSMTYSGADCVAIVGGILSTIVADSPTANDFDSNFNNYLGTYSLLDRLSLLSTATGRTASPILLKGTDSAEQIVNTILSNNGASSRFLAVTPLTQVLSTAYTPVSTPLLVLAAVRNTVVGWSGSNSRSSITFGSTGFTFNSFISSSATYTSSDITSYSSLYYIDSANNSSIVTSRGVVAPFNSLSAPIFTSTNTNLIIQALTNNNPATILLIQVSTESLIRNSGVAGVAGPSDALAQSFLESLSNNSATAGYNFNDILDKPASAAFNHKPAIRVVMEAAVTNPSKLESIIEYSGFGGERLANAKSGFSSLSASDKEKFVANACKMGIEPSELFAITSSDERSKAQVLFNAMAADITATGPSVAPYKEYLTSIKFSDVKEVFLTAGNCRVGGKSTSDLPAAEKIPPVTLPTHEWFLAFNEKHLIQELKDIGALPQQLFTWTKPIKVFNYSTGIITNPQDQPHALVFGVDRVKQTYDLSMDEVFAALSAAGIITKADDAGDIGF